MYLTPPLKGFPLEFGIGEGVRRNQNDGATIYVYVTRVKMERQKEGMGYQQNCQKQ